MSHHASSWAIEQTPTMPDTGKPDPYGKLVLLVLADLAGQDGVLWHASTSISEQACMPAPTVRKVIQRLEACGLLARVERRRADGSNTASITVLAPSAERGSMRPADDPQRYGREIQEAIGDRFAVAPTPVTQTEQAVTQGYGAVSSGYGGSEPVNEPVSEPERENAQARARGLDGKNLRSIVGAIQQEAEYWNDRGHSKFYDLWCAGECDAVGRLLSEQPPAVRVHLTEYLFTQMAVGWEGKRIALPLSHGPLDAAKAKASATGRPLFGNQAVRPANKQAEWGAMYRAQAAQQPVYEGEVVE